MSTDNHLSREFKNYKEDHKLSSVTFLLDSGQKAEQQKNFSRISKTETKSQLILKYLHSSLGSGISVHSLGVDKCVLTEEKVVGGLD